MGWFSSDVTKTVDAVGNAFNKLFTSDDERAQATFVLEKLRAQPQIINLEINKALASHSSRFVAGARPTVIYCCALGFLYSATIAPIISQLFGYPMPAINMMANMEMLGAVLGLGSMRTYEKKNGVAS